MIAGRCLLAASRGGWNPTQWPAPNVAAIIRSALSMLSGMSFLSRPSTPVALRSETVRPEKGTAGEAMAARISALKRTDLSGDASWRRGES